MIFMFKRDGYLETLGPAGTNTMNTLCVTSFITNPGNLTRTTVTSIQGMVEQLTNMQRVANTPIPVSCEHNKS